MKIEFPWARKPGFEDDYNVTDENTELTVVELDRDYRNIVLVGAPDWVLGWTNVKINGLENYKYIKLCDQEYSEYDLRCSIRFFEEDFNGPVNPYLRSSLHRMFVTDNEYYINHIRLMVKRGKTNIDDLMFVFISDDGKQVHCCKPDSNGKLDYPDFFYSVLEEQLVELLG